LSFWLGVIESKGEVEGFVVGVLAYFEVTELDCVLEALADRVGQVEGRCAAWAAVAIADIVGSSGAQA
jgi:hypothetical protein